MLIGRNAVFKGSFKSPRRINSMFQDELYLSPERWPPVAASERAEAFRLHAGCERQLILQRQA